MTSNKRLCSLPVIRWCDIKIFGLLWYWFFAQFFVYCIMIWTVYKHGRYVYIFDILIWWIRDYSFQHNCFYLKQKIRYVAIWQLNEQLIKTEIKLFNCKMCKNQKLSISIQSNECFGNFKSKQQQQKIHSIYIYIYIKCTCSSMCATQ